MFVKSWSNVEDKVVLENYLKVDGIKTIEQILPDRKYNQIKGRANYLGLKRTGHLYKDESFFEHWVSFLQDILDGYLYAE